MKTWLFCFLSFVGLALTVPPAVAQVQISQAEKRIALVIGNGAYQNTNPLPNPTRDAKAVAGSLRRLGFEVIEGLDLDQTSLNKRIQEFARASDNADVALFFYAGHGMQMNGENFLIPVDAALKRESDLDFEAVRVDTILRQMQRARGPKIVVLDSCRDNPLATQLARTLAGRSRSANLGSGMSEINVQNATGTLIAFATAPGAVAYDGDGEHSPFTTALVRHMETPGLDIDLVMKRVRGEVVEKTGDRQRPWTNSSLTDEFFLKPLPKADAAPAASTPAAPNLAVAALGPTTSVISGGSDANIGLQLDMERWRAAERTGKLDDYQDYLRNHPGGAFADIARRRVAAIEGGRSVTSPGGAPLPLGTTQKDGAQRSAVPPEVQKAPATQLIERGLKLDKDDWEDVQRRLNLAGIPVSVSGRATQPTRDALRKWQRENIGIDRPTGFLNKEQVEFLTASTNDAYQSWTDKGKPAFEPPASTAATAGGAVAGAAAGAAAAAAVSSTRQRAAARQQTRRVEPVAVQRVREPREARRVPPPGSRPAHIAEEERRRAGMRPASSSGSSSAGSNAFIGGVLGGVVGGALGGAIGRRW
jgi:uncharacterized caspase-like protein